MSPELQQAVLGAQNIQSPASTLGASQAPELAALYQSSFQLPQSSGAVSAGANIAADQVAAAKRAAAEAKQREQDLADPSKYRAVQKEDGGYDFFAPDGSQVDIATLTQRTQTKATDWIKDSQNPIDIQYLEDQKNVNGFINAILTKDQDKINKYRNQAAAEYGEDVLAPYVSGRGGVDKLLKQFQKNYQRYYVPRSVNPQSWGTAPGLPTVPIGSSLSEFGGEVAQSSSSGFTTRRK